MLGYGGSHAEIKVGKGTGIPLWWAAMYACNYRCDVGVKKHTYDKTTSDQREGALRLVKLLLEKGAKVDAVGSDYDKEGTSLWWAARAVREGRVGALELATLLVEHGADVNKLGTNAKAGEEASSSPLRWAASAVHDGRADGPELARLLLSADARLAHDEGVGGIRREAPQAGLYDDVYRFNSELQQVPKKQAPEKKKEVPKKQAPGKQARKKQKQ